jgi:hypothetical protein
VPEIDARHIRRNPYLLRESSKTPKHRPMLKNNIVSEQKVVIHPQTHHKIFIARGHQMIKHRHSIITTFFSVHSNVAKYIPTRPDFILTGIIRNKIEGSYSKLCFLHFCATL